VILITFQLIGIAVDFDERIIVIVAWLTENNPKYIYGDFIKILMY